MDAKEISRLALYVAGGLLGLYLIYYGIVVDPNPQTVAVGAALAGIDALAALNIDGVKTRVPGDIPEPEGGDDVVVLGFDDEGLDESVSDDISEGGEADAPGKYGE